MEFEEIAAIVVFSVLTIVLFAALAYIIFSGRKQARAREELQEQQKTAEWQHTRALEKALLAEEAMARAAKDTAAARTRMSEARARAETEVLEANDRLSLARAERDRAIENMEYFMNTYRSKLNTLAESFTCPIISDITNDPILADDGNFYDREAFLGWVATCNRNLTNLTSPLTRQPMTPSIREVRAVRDFNESVLNLIRWEELSEYLNSRANQERQARQAREAREARMTSENS